MFDSYFRVSHPDVMKRIWRPLAEPDNLMVWAKITLSKGVRQTLDDYSGSRSRSIGNLRVGYGLLCRLSGDGRASPNTVK
jgi:hypothetical protein